MNNELVVSSSPFVHGKNDVNKMFLFISLALVIPAIYGVVLYGLSAFLVIITSLLTCTASEILYNLFSKKRFFIDNLSFLVTGLVLALTLPAKTPIYAVILVAFFAVFIVKMVFGGLGRNPFNPALTARCLAGLIVPSMSAELYSATVFGEEFASLTSGGSNIISNLLVGQAVGGVGTTFIIILLACGVALSIFEVIDVKLPILAIISYFAISLCLNNVETTMINMFSGSFIFVSIFVITDPNSSPNTLLGKFIYAVGFGALSALVWSKGWLGENTIFAVALLMNFLVPFMDKYFVLKPVSIGGYRYARKN